MACTRTTSPSSSGARTYACGPATTVPSPSCAASAYRRPPVPASRPTAFRRTWTRSQTPCAAPARSLRDGRPVPRLHPRPLQAAAELRRAGPPRPRGPRPQPPLRGRDGRAHPRGGRQDRRAALPRPGLRDLAGGGLDRLGRVHRHAARGAPGPRRRLADRAVGHPDLRDAAQVRAAEPEGHARCRDGRRELAVVADKTKTLLDTGALARVPP